MISDAADRLAVKALLAHLLRCDVDRASDPRQALQTHRNQLMGAIRGTAISGPPQKADQIRHEALLTIDRMCEWIHPRSPE